MVYNYSKEIEQEFNDSLEKGEINLGELYDLINEYFLNKFPNIRKEDNEKESYNTLIKLLKDKRNFVKDKNFILKNINKIHFKEDDANYLFLAGEYKELEGVLFFDTRSFLDIGYLNLVGNLHVKGQKVEKVFFHEVDVSGEFNITDKRFTSNKDNNENVLKLQDVGGKKINIKRLKKENKESLDINLNITYTMGYDGINPVINLENLKNIISFYINGSKNINFEEVNLKNFNTLSEENSNYFFVNFKTNKFEIDFLNNYSNNFILQNIEIEELIIKNSNLGNMIFNGVKIKKLYIENVVLNDCIFNGVEFPYGYKLEKNYNVIHDNGFKENTKNLSSNHLKDNYRQLKFIMDKNGNFTEADNFFSKEMNEYFLTLSFINNFSKKIILLFQGLISYFGSCWFLSLLWIVLFGLVITQIQEGNYFYFNFSFDHYLNINFYNKFFSNINPFDKRVFSLDGITYGLFFHKVVLVVLYWHLIVALKRTTKR